AASAPPVAPPAPEASVAAPVAPRPAPAPGPEAPGPAASPEGAAVPETFPTASARRQGPTLDDLVAGAWEGLLAGAPADCLVCGTPSAPGRAPGAGVVGGRCDGCGTTVS